MKRKIWIIAICFLGMILLEGNSTFVSKAYTQTSGKVITASGKVRAEANTTSEAIGSVKSGDTITIVDEAKGADGKVWYQVVVDADKKGYIRSDLVEKSADSKADTVTTTNTADTKPKAEVTAMDKQSGNILNNSVRVRKDASTASDVVATVGRGVAMTVSGKATGADGKTWYEVSFSYNNKTITGFVRSDFITFDELPEEEPATAEISGSKGTDKKEPDKKEPETSEEETEMQSTEEAPDETVPETKEEPKEEPEKTTLAYQLMNVEELPTVPKGYVEIELDWNGEKIRAWKNGDFYIFYASTSEGNEGWYRFDQVEGTYQRYDSGTEAAKAGLFGNTSQMILVIVLVVIIIALIIAVTLLLIKLNDYKNEEWEEEDDGLDEAASKEKAKKTWKALNFLTSDDYDDDDDDDYDDDDDDDYDDEVRARVVRRPVPQSTGAPVRRPMPQGERPQGTRPQGSGAPVRRPAPQGERPQGTRPQGSGAPVRRPAPQGERPQGTRPQGAEAPVRRPAPQGERPQGTRPPQSGAPVRRPVPQGGRPQGEGTPVRRPRPQSGNTPVRKPASREEDY